MSQPLRRQSLSALRAAENKFNNKPQSDIEFHFGGNHRVIYATCDELVHHSSKFRDILAPRKHDRIVMLITDYSYAHFFEFIRYFYDASECVVSESNVIELLKLAIAYKVTTLENKIISFILSSAGLIEMAVEVFNYCVDHDYYCLYNRMRDYMAEKLPEVLTTVKFRIISPETLEHILKLREVVNTVSEFDILSGFVVWLRYFCDTQNIDIATGRSSYEYLFKLIRVQTIQDRLFWMFRNDNTDLFTLEDDMAYRCDRLNHLDGKCFQHYVPYWTAEKRIFTDFGKYENWNPFRNKSTIFTTNKRVQFYGAWVGNSNRETITISLYDEKKILVRKWQTVEKRPSNYSIVKFDKPVTLQPHKRNVLDVKYTKMYEGKGVNQRTPNKPIYIKNSIDQIIHYHQTNPVVFELFFHEQ